MRIRAAGILIQNNSIALMHRIKNGREYYVIPGGGVEENETTEEATIREIKEEVGIDVKVIKKMYEYKDEKSSQLFYLVEQTGGVFGTGEGPEFITPNPNKGYYHMEMISFEDISKINLVPEEIKIKLIEDIKLNRV